MNAQNMPENIYQKILGYRLSAFLIFCLILGGTSQDIVAPKLPLYLVSLCFIGWALTALKRDSLIWQLKTLVIFIAVFAIVNLLYLIPLPPALWTELPGRDNVIKGYELMDMPLPWLPVSLTPEKTLFSLFDVLPPFAVLMIIGTLATIGEIKKVIWVLPLFAVFTILLGIAQIAGVSSYLYFYAITNDASPVGFFSNINHQASFLLMVLPFTISLAVTDRTFDRDGAQSYVIRGISSAASIIILIGVLFAGSISGYILAILTVFSVLLLNVNFVHRGTKRIVASVAVLIVLGIVADFLFLGNYLGELMAEFTGTEPGSRQVMFATTLQAARDYFPYGTGLGSFSDVYRLYETPWNRIIMHTHNDFIEVLLEFGVFGAIFMAAFFLWWGKLVRQIFTNRSGRMLWAKCGVISTFVILGHSLADYPLRTIGISSFVIYCICLAVLGRNIGTYLGKKTE